MQEGATAQEGHHGFVSLPKLDFPSFNGDNLHVSEFWDSIEATGVKTIT